MKLLLTNRYVCASCVLAVCLALFFGGHQIIVYLEELADFQRLAAEAMFAHPAVILALLFYVVLLAIPFVPGAELGLFLLLIFGADIAAIVYIATVLGMCLSYGLGALIPNHHLARFAGHFGLGDKLRQASARARDCGVRDPWRARGDIWFCRLLRHRYVALAVVINTPGNTVLGGGGGISLAAGLSGLYRPVWFLGTTLVAVAPVPLAVLLLQW